MPANGQKAAGTQLSNFFGGFDQKLNALNQPAAGVRGGDADAQEGGFYGGSAPPMAAAAPTKGSGELFTSLCDALNQHQQELVKKKYYEIDDEYVITFANVNDTVTIKAENYLLEPCKCID